MVPTFSGPRSARIDWGGHDHQREAGSATLRFRDSGSRPSGTQATPRNKCVDFSFGKTKFVLRSFHGVPSKPTSPSARGLLQPRYGAKKFGERPFRCNSQAASLDSAFSGRESGVLSPPASALVD